MDRVALNHGRIDVLYLNAGLRLSFVLVAPVPIIAP